jgi:lipopolysaccharide transport system permease protein
MSSDPELNHSIRYDACRACSRERKNVNLDSNKSRGPPVRSKNWALRELDKLITHIAPKKAPVREEGIPGMLTYFDSIWKCRYFWISLVKLDLRTRYRRSYLGMGWSLLHPVCMTLVMCLVFPKIFHQSIVDFAPNLLAGLAVWQYIVNCTIQGCQSFFQGEQYIRQTPMPLAIFPLRTVLSSTFHFVIALGLVIVLTSVLAMMGLRDVHPFALLHIIPGVAMLFVFCWSVAVLAALMNVFFHDTQHLAEVGFQMFFYVTPILYKANVLEEHGLGWLIRLNPVVVFLQLIREPLLDGVAPSVFTYFQGLAIISLTTALACLVLARLQKRLIFHM